MVGWWLVVDSAKKIGIENKKKNKNGLAKKNYVLE